MNSINQYQPSDNLTQMIGKNFIWGLIGIVLGVLVNLILQSGVAQIGGKYENEAKLMLQLMICSFVLAFIQVKMNNKFGWTWQNITPGLFFVSYFFGSQFATFANIQTFNNNITQFLKLTH